MHANRVPSLNRVSFLSRVSSMNHRRLLRLAGTAVLVTALSVGLALPTFANGDLLRGKPAEVGLSAERLERIGIAMQGHIDDKIMSGALGMIARNGKIAYLETWGDADRENGVAMREDTIFRIYSMSKPITSVAVLMLYEEGKLFLNDPIGKYIPELRTLQVATLSADEDGEAGKTRNAKSAITIRDLLRHTSGLTYGFFGNTEVDRKYRAAGLLLTDHDLEQFIGKLSEIPLLYEPGTRWHYGVSTDVLGRLVEVVSGQTFEKFLQDRIFSPLGMVDTSFWVPHEKRSRFAQLYAPDGIPEGSDAFLARTTGTAIKVAPEMTSRNYLSKDPATFFSGGGGLASTASDYMRFCLMMLGEGQLNGTRLLSPKTVELMTTDHMVGIDDAGPILQSGYGFGLGYAISKGPGALGEYTSKGEYNWGGAAGTKFWIDPEENLIGIYMVQIMPHRTTLGNEFRTLTYQSIVE